MRARLPRIEIRRRDLMNTCDPVRIQEEIGSEVKIWVASLEPMRIPQELSPRVLANTQPRHSLSTQPPTGWSLRCAHAAPLRRRLK